MSSWLSSHLARAAPFPFSLATIVVSVFDEPSMKIGDDPSRQIAVPVNLVVNDAFARASTESIQPSFLDWGELIQELNHSIQGKLDTRTSEFGFTTKTPDGQDQVYKIWNDVTFRNAMALLHSHWEPGQPKHLRVYLWPRRWTPRDVSEDLDQLDLYGASPPRGREGRLTELAMPGPHPARHVGVEHEEPPQDPVRARTPPPQPLGASDRVAGHTHADAEGETAEAHEPPSAEHRRRERERDHDDAPCRMHEASESAPGSDEGDAHPAPSSHPPAPAARLPLDDMGGEMPGETGQSQDIAISDRTEFDAVKLVREAMQHSSASDTPPHREDFDDDDELGYGYALRMWQDAQTAALEFEFIESADSVAVQHLNPGYWERVCTFFGHPLHFIQPEYYATVPGGFQRKLLPVQLHATYWVLGRNHGIVGSALLCHIMGIGKTTIALAVHHVQHVLNVMWHEIFDQHLPDNQHPLDADGTCTATDQMRRKYGYACPCSDQSPTHFVKPKLGVTLTLAPKNLMETWKEQHIACFGPHNPAQRFVFCHGDKKVPTPEERALIRGEVRHPGEGASPDVYQPTLANSGVMVCTTAESVCQHFFSKFEGQNSVTWTAPDHVSVMKNGKSRTTRGKTRRNYGLKYSQVVVSMLCRDESHDRQAQLMAPYASQIRHQSPEFPISYLFMSGTPLMRGPEDIRQLVDIMANASPRWKHSPRLAQWVDGTLARGLAEEWEKMLKRGTHDADIVAKMKRHFTPLVEQIMIRWTTESRFFHEAPVRVPKSFHRDITCDHGAYWNTRIASLYAEEAGRIAARDRARLAQHKAKGGTIGTYRALETRSNNLYYVSRMCANFPALVDVTDVSHERPSMTGMEWKRQTAAESGTWVPGTATDPYYAHLETICASSAKLRALQQQIEVYSGMVDAEGRPPRMIFSSFFFVGAYILQLWLQHILRIPAEEVIFLHSQMSEKARLKELARFHLDTSSRTPPAQQKTARFIVATNSAFAVGITLAEAMVVCFLEPEWRVQTIAQGKARHCRQGNRNPEVETWMLFAKDNTIEQSIVQKGIIGATMQEVATRKTGHPLPPVPQPHKRAWEEEEEDEDVM